MMMSDDKVKKSAKRTASNVANQKPLDNLRAELYRMMDDPPPDRALHVHRRIVREHILAMNAVASSRIPLGSRRAAKKIKYIGQFRAARMFPKDDSQDDKKINKKCAPSPLARAPPSPAHASSNKSNNVNSVCGQQKSLVDVDQQAAFILKGHELCYAEDDPWTAIKTLFAEELRDLTPSQIQELFESLMGIE